MEEEIIEKAIAARSGKAKPTYADLAAHLLNDAARGNELRKAVERRLKTARLVIPKIESLLEPYELDLAGYLYLDNKPALIIADVHAPFYDKHLLEYSVKLAKHRNIRRVIIAGDLFDANALSNYKKQQEPFVPIEVDLKWGLSVAKYLTDNLETIYLPGNHCWWMYNHFGVTVDGFWKQTNLPIITTEYPFLFIGTDIMVGHLESYSDIAGFEANKIAKNKKRHTLVGHDHMVGYYFDQFYGVSIGAMVSADNFYYKRSAFNAYPDWQNGFALLTDSVELFRGESKYYEF